MVIFLHDSQPLLQYGCGVIYVVICGCPGKHREGRGWSNCTTNREPKLGVGSCYCSFPSLCQGNSEMYIMWIFQLLIMPVQNSCCITTLTGKCQIICWQAYLIQRPILMFCLCITRSTNKTNIYNGHTIQYKTTQYKWLLLIWAGFFRSVNVLMLSLSSTEWSEQLFSASLVYGIPQGSILPFLSYLLPFQHIFITFNDISYHC